MDDREEVVVMTKPAHRYLEEVTTTRILEEENQTDRNKPFPQPVRAAKQACIAGLAVGLLLAREMRFLDFVELAGAAGKTIKVLKKTRMYLIPRN